MAASQAAREAAALECARVNRTLKEVSAAAVESALGCLARRDTASRQPFDSRWRRTSIRLRGEVDAARIWARLRATAGGRRALAAAAKDRADLVVAVSDRSRITLRASR